MSRFTSYSYTQTDQEADHDMKKSGFTTASDGVTITSSTRGSERTKKGTQQVAVAMNNLKGKCILLKKYASYKKIDLPREVYKIFLEVNELAVQVGSTDQYSNFLRITSEVFEGVALGDGSTVADFFAGCGNSRARPGSSIGCELQCAGNLPPEGYTTDHFCDTHVGNYNEGVLSIHYSPTEKMNTITIYHTDEVVLSAQDLSNLKKRGVTHAILEYTGGSVRVTSEPQEISSLGGGLQTKAKRHYGDLQEKSERSSSRGTPVQKKSSKKRESSSYSGLWIALLVIIILVILIICFVASSYSTGYEQASQHPYTSHTLNV